MNIYRYLCENVTYDYVTFEYMKIKNDFSITSFGNYNCFYLEGVFLDLDNQYAVCDGIAKAYVLLCNMEGIDCIKVNGEVVNQGNHAWNKVNILNPQTSQKEWSYVDATWGVVTYCQESDDSNSQDIIYDNFEVLSHSYFLTGEDESKLISYEAGVEEEVGEFNYYKMMNYSFKDDFLNEYSGDFYIDSDEEFKEVFEYAKSILSSQKISNPLQEASMVLEIKLDKIYANDSDKKAYEFKFLNKTDNMSKTIEWFNSMGISEGIGSDWFILEDVILFRFYM